MKAIPPVFMLLLFQIGTTHAQAPPRSETELINTDRLGESLKRFYANHDDARCGPTSDKKWTICSAEKGFTFAERNLIEGSIMMGSFYKKRLVGVMFNIDSPSMETVLPELQRRYGLPQRFKFNLTGPIVSATWLRGDACLAAELVPIPREVNEAGVIRLIPGRPVQAVQISVSSNRLLTSAWRASGEHADFDECAPAFPPSLGSNEHREVSKRKASRIYAWLPFLLL